MMANILFPIPRRDFDPTEVAISWQVLTAAGHRVTFATPDGAPGEADPIMVTGIGLDPWSRVPGLRQVRLIGLFLRANTDARRAHSAMITAPEFTCPKRWEDLRVDDFDGLLLPGGHRARGMREYLESPVLQKLVVAFFAADKPVGAICHGVLLAARSLDPSGKSVLHGRRTTALTWALERAASEVGRLGRYWDPDYYRTYVEEPGQPAGFMSVEHEVARAGAAFVDVPKDAPHHAKKTSGLSRDTASDDAPAFTVGDGKYVSARWPGDAHTFAKRFAALL